MRTRLIALAAVLVVAGCSSGPEVRKQAYAELPNERVFEHEFPVVWVGIESAVSKNKVLERDPEEVDAVELKRLSKRTLETDWVYSQSRDKYVEYKIGGVPKRKELQIRIKYEIIAKRVIGGTQVTVKAKEEVEKLKDDGTPNGYSEMEPDPSRSAEILERINLSILAAAP